MNSLSFQDKVVVIVGGARGVGLRVAEEVNRNGGQVVIGDRQAHSFGKLLELTPEPGPEPVFVQADLNKVDNCRNLFRVTMEKFGRLDACYCYAGVTYPSSLVECTEEHFDEVFNVNVKGTFFCCKFAVESMMQSGGGSIVLTGSPHAWGGDKDRLVYACSKGVLLPLMKNISQHYAGDGIRVNLVTMGWTPTEGELELRESQNMSLDELRQLANTIIPAGRMTEIDDLVPGILYLLSDASRMVSGSNLRVTGGWYL